MRLFWSRGYQKTSMSDIERALKIGRASVYAAFTDKQVLFLRALERYRERQTLPCLSILEDDLPPLDALGELLDCLAVRYADPATPLGCLVVLNTGHVGDEAPEARTALAASVSHGEAMIRRTLDRAVQQGDLRADADTAALARFLAATTQGMATMARLGRTEAEVRQIGRIALGVATPTAR